MCGKGEGNYTQKYLCGCTLIKVVIDGESGASVEMSGENELALFEQTSGIHLLEINGSHLGSNGGNG